MRLHFLFCFCTAPEGCFWCWCRKTSWCNGELCHRRASHARVSAELRRHPFRPSYTLCKPSHDIKIIQCNHACWETCRAKRGWQASATTESAEPSGSHDISENRFPIECEGGEGTAGEQSPSGRLRLRSPIGGSRGDYARRGRVGCQLCQRDLRLLLKLLGS